MAERMSLEDAVKRMNEIAEELANGTPELKGKKIIELRKLCGRHLTVPNAYQLEGILKDEPMPRWSSQVSELWKGEYKDQEVVLKVFRGTTDAQKSRLYKEVVLMKQVNHENIIPFYGVLATSTAFDFCAVFPWYEKGRIMHHLDLNPDIDRYRLLLGAISGLGFLHDTHLVHGALQPSHILIDDDGNARLTTIHSSIIADSGASTSSLAQSSSGAVGEARDFVYSAPEIEWPEEEGLTNVTRTRESDVYGMAMVIYEVLTGTQPYRQYRYFDIPSQIRNGEFPGRPPNKVDDLVWGLLEKCWSKYPERRPKTFELRNAFSDLVYYRGQPTAGELPGKLRVLVQNIKILLDERKKRRFIVKLAYGDQIYVTAPTKPADTSGGYTWIDPESWIITTNQQNLGHLVSLQLLQREIFFKKDKILAEGHFSLLGNVNKPILVNFKAPDGTGLAVLKVFLMEM